MLKKSRIRDRLYTYNSLEREAEFVAVSYKKLFHLLIDRNMSNSQLAQQAGISLNIITRLKRNEYVSLETIEKICNTCHCEVSEILEFVSGKDGDCNV